MDALVGYAKSRRTFLKNMGTLAALSTFSSLGGCESIAEAIKNRPTRRRIRTGSPEVDDMMQVYANAVAAMKALPTTDRRNWGQQAQIHVSFCPHGSWFFLPWHRAYLGYFEQICRELTGRPDFGLPYWNWALGSAVPTQFTNPSSALYDPSRNASAGANSSVVSHSNMESILGQTNFFLFGSSPTAKGQLESGPHDTTHGGVGGNMGFVSTAALDPVFWAHHCMVDYCWVDWNVNRDNPNPNDPAWAEHVFVNQFSDKNGNLITANMTPALTALFPLLSYQYEASQIGTASMLQKTLVKNTKELRAVQKKLEEGAEVSVRVRKKIPVLRGQVLPLEQGLAAEPILTDAADFERLLAQRSAERAVLNIGFAEFPKTNDFFVRLYLNNDSGQPDPGMKSIHYAGSFGFFSDQHDAPGTPSRYLVDMTETVARLKKAGKIGADNALRLQLVAVPIGADEKVFADRTLAIEDISLDISTVSVK